MRALPLLLFLALLAPRAAALQADAHAWEWRVFEGRAQARDSVVVRGPGADIALELPAQAQAVQVFLDDRATPWEWVGPRTIQVHAARLLGEPDATVHLLVLSTVPVGPGGLAVERALTMSTQQLSVRADAPEGWAAALDGAPLPSDLGPLPQGRVLALRIAPAAGPSPVVVLGALTLLVLLGTMARALTARGKAVRREMGLLDHLRELTGRARVALLAVALLMLAFFAVGLTPARVGGVELAVPTLTLTDNLAAQTFRLLSQQFVPAGVELVVVDPVSAAFVQVEVALFLAVLVASPLLAYEAGAFLMPALEARERRLLVRSIPAVTGLFAAGALFAYALMVPTMMRVLYAYAQGLGARPFIAVDSLVSFAVIVTLAFGLAFELPVAMVALAKLGLVQPRTMAQKWRHVVVGLFVLAAVITPDPSVVSQVLVALPLLGLYVVGLVAARAAVREPRSARAAAAGAARR